MANMESTHKALLDWLEAQMFDGAPFGDVIEREPNLSPVDAYRLRDALMKRRIARGDPHIGYKVAGAARVIQTTEHTEGATVGCLMRSGLIAENEAFSVAGYQRVIVESEVAVLLKRDLTGPGVTALDVLRAIEGYMPAIEVIAQKPTPKRSHPMRILGTKFSGGGIVVGGPMSAPHGIDLRLEGMVISINGQVRGSATGVEVMGDPVNSVAFMANTLGEIGESLKAGMVLMTGSFIGNLPVAAGDDVCVEFTRLGRVHARFKA